ncbi:hypothetical protein [Candidatus Methanomassiliicoccus intestinalis]|uniref:hypothetical protein n=1 Tax=Candidatus Methanomassiliicoccus intestinalis TaxID=1406512 RepID=UPI0037DCF7D8
MGIAHPRLGVYRRSAAIINQRTSQFAGSIWFGEGIEIEAQHVGNSIFSSEKMTGIDQFIDLINDTFWQTY